MTLDLDVRTENVYDCFSLFTGDTYSGPDNITDWSQINIFGNANVGNINLTSQQVAGMLAHGNRYFIALRWYARTLVPPTLMAAQVFQQIHARFIVNQRFSWQLTLFDLLARHPQYRNDGQPLLFDPYPMIPPRAFVQVQIIKFHDGGRNLVHELGLPAAPRPLVWVHFEGVSCESEIAAQELAYQLTAERKEQITHEQRLVQWIRGFKRADDEPGAPERNAELDVITDGIMEQRHLV